MPQRRLAEERNLSPILETSREEESLEGAQRLSVGSDAGLVVPSAETENSGDVCEPEPQEMAGDEEETPELSRTDPCSDSNIAMYTFLLAIFQLMLSLLAGSEE